MIQAAAPGSAPAATVAAGGAGPGRTADARAAPDGFDRLLRQRETTTAASRATHAGSTPAQRCTHARADDGTRDADPERDLHAGATCSGAAPDAPAAEDAAEPASGPTAAPWPPPGLAGLVLPPAMVATDVAAATAPDATTTLASAEASVHRSCPPSGCTSLPGMAPTAAAADALAPIADGAAAVADAAGLAQALSGGDDAATAARGDGGPSPVLLHGVAAAAWPRPAAEPPAAPVLDAAPMPAPGHEGFDDAIGARIGWLAGQKIGHAHLQLSPDGLGAIDVRLRMDGDRLDMSFSSPHVEVRHALESSLPRLRELLGEQGFQLAHADIGQPPPGSRDQRHAPPADSGSDRETGAGGTEVVLPSARLIRQRGLLDAYA